MYGALRREIGPILKELCRRYQVDLIEGHVMSDHVHMMLSIPPKLSVAHLIGKLKGKSTILINQKYVRQRNFKGLSFWSRGYCVSTTGFDESIIRNYIRNQEVHDKRDEQLLLDV
jgi:putative transposase